MTPVAAAVLGAAYIERDDARAVPWADPRFEKFSSAAARCLVSAAEAAWPPPARDGDGLVGVYLASGETGLDVHAFAVGPPMGHRPGHRVDAGTQVTRRGGSEVDDAVDAAHARDLSVIRTPRSASSRSNPAGGRAPRPRRGPQAQ